MKEYVNHPKHYNQHPCGIECIDVIRHYVCDIANALKYLWRAGLKAEMGKEDADKEVEDLKKALWYIEDYRVKIPKLRMLHFKTPNRMERIVAEVTGWSVDQIACGAKDNLMFIAIRQLLTIGILRRGEVRVNDHWDPIIKDITVAIRARIRNIEHEMLKKEIKSTAQMLNGQMVDGENTAKPGGVRDTEPDDYDPLNLIITAGTVFSLTDKVRKKSNGALYSPCDNCALKTECLSADGTTPVLKFCEIHGAASQEYYREVGVAKYSPSFGTIEVVDEHKELLKLIKESDDDLDDDDDDDE